MTIIKFIVLIRAYVAIETCLFVASLLIMFSTAVPPFHPIKEIHILLHNMESIKIVIRKEIWRIRRGGQRIKIIFRGNRDGSWEQIWGIAGSLCKWGLSSKVMRGRFKDGIPNSSIKELSNQS